MDLAVACYNATKTFPPSETYSLTSQIRRASTSIAANIAEGYGRDSAGNFIQFLKVAQGSLKELETHLIVSQRVGLLESTELDTLLARCEETGRMLGGLIRSVRKRQGT